MQAFAAAERFVDAAGTRVRLVEAGSGRPLFLLHGLGQSSAAWQRVLGPLSRRCRVIAIDLPGFGGSDAPLGAPYGPEYFADVLDAVASAMRLDGADAIGHSAGGLALLLNALRRPGRYSRIVLVDPAGFTPAPDSVVGTAAASLARLLVSIPRSRAMTRALYATAFHDPQRVDEATVDEIHASRADGARRSASRRAFARYFDFCRHLDPFLERLAGLDARVLAIWGDDDRLFRARDPAAVRRAIPAARVEVFERCGHCPQIERPDRFVSAVTEFLEQP